MFKKENLPNLLTLARIILIPIFLLMTSLASSNVMHITAAVVFAIASITDYLDGYLARKWHLAAAMPGKIKTVTQMLSIILLLCHVHFVGTIMLYVALFFTIYSGYDYFKGAGFLFKDTFK